MVVGELTNMIAGVGKDLFAVRSAHRRNRRTRTLAAHVIRATIFHGVFPKRLGILLQSGTNLGDHVHAKIIGTSSGDVGCVAMRNSI